MYKYILESAGDINWMAIFALTTFFFIFIMAAVTALLSKPEMMNKMANMPLEDSYSFTAETADQDEK
ncbi:MAG: hypothetical protein AAF798_20870 [Bacteroidota bacterium]